MLILDLGGYWREDRPLDPYLRWAERTNFRSLGNDDGTMVSQLSFIIERKPGECSDWSAFRLLVGVSVPGAYDEALADGKLSTFATVRIDIKDLDPGEMNKRVLALLRHVCAERLQLGYPRGRAADPAGCVDAPKGLCQANVVLGIIDDGCPFAHPDLRDDTGQSRLSLLWQQTILDAAEAPWLRPEGFDHGRILNQAAMAWLMTQASHDGEVDELKCYEAAFATDEPDLGCRKASREMLPRASHGGSVMAVAAGTPAELHGQRPCYEAGNDLYSEPEDAASTCPIIFVDLPREQVEISSGRWISINALDGLRFIRREARKRFYRPDGAPLPVVVNLSSGSTAGAHVGEAMLERAMDELLDADPYLAVTLAAGNSRVSESHAQLRVPKSAGATLGVFVPPMQPFDTFVEFWLPEGQDLSKVSVLVQSADGQSLTVSLAKKEDYLGSTATDLSAALLFYPKVVQATNRTMILLVVAGTVARIDPKTRQRVDSAAGPWLVSVVNGGDADMSVQAWIERDEIVFGNRRDQAARFFATDDEPESVKALLRRTHTMSNISTGAQVFAVGAYRGLTASGAAAKYSGAPAEEWAHLERYLPFAAKADAGRSHPGVRVPGNRGNVMRRMNGTSVAAPQAARYVVNRMAAGETRHEIEDSLETRPLPLPKHPYEPLNPDGPNDTDEPLDPDDLYIDPSDGRLRL